MMSRPNEDAVRAAAFIHSVEDRCATKLEEWDLGTAVFNLDFPNKWDMNFLRLERDNPSMSAEDIAGVAERLQGAAGLTHRKVIAADFKAGARLAQGFRKLDWNVTRLVWMTRQSSIPEPGPVEVKEMSFDDVKEEWIAVDVEERQMSRDESEMVWRSTKEVVAKVTDAKLFGGIVEGRVAGWCEYHRGERIGQVENVSTTLKARDRGVARSVIAAALARSASDGNDLDFLIADDDDWPKELYGRLGFQPVAYTYEFMLKPKT